MTIKTGCKWQTKSQQPLVSEICHLSVLKLAVTSKGVNLGPSDAVCLCQSQGRLALKPIRLHLCLTLMADILYRNKHHFAFKITSEIIRNNPGLWHTLWFYFQTSETTMRKKKEHTNTQIHYISRYFIKCMTFYEFAVIASKHIGWTTWNPLCCQWPCPYSWLVAKATPFMWTCS